MKKMSKKVIGMIIGGALLIVVIVGVAGVIILGTNAQEAREIALNYSGGGEIVGQEVENEGLLNEYKFKIVNGDTWYEIQIGGFGQIEEVETGNGSYYWD